MRTVVIGGTGHIGTYLVPRLVRAGHTVLEVSRGTREPYHQCAEWNDVEQVKADRAEEDTTGAFARRTRDLKADVVIDLICFEPDSARQMVDALRGDVQLYEQCGSTWVHGYSEVVPTLEEHPRRPLEPYGQKKDAIDKLLMKEARQSGFPATVMHAGHIVGPGWPPLNPAGNFLPGVFTALAKGTVVTLPNLGLETVHHVHADDVAQAFMRAIDCWRGAVGESFHVVSEQAVTLRGYAEAVARWFGREANLVFAPWPQWAETETDEHAISQTETHLHHTPHCSIAKAKRLLGYQPRYTSLEAVREAVDWLVAEGVVQTK